MNAIVEASKIDLMTIFLGAFIILFAIKEIVELYFYFKKRMRLKTGIDQDKETLETRISQLERHDKWQYEEISKILVGVDSISSQLDSMQQKIDATEMAKLKDSLLSYYRRYKDVGEWSQFDSDAFWSLYDRYIAHDGNSFIKSAIAPVMKDLEVVD